MKVCVIGGAGYIGSRLVPALLERGHEVWVVEVFWFGSVLLKACYKAGNFGGSYTDARELSAHDLKGFDAVIFLAGLSNDPMAEFAPRLNFEFNAALPAYLAWAAATANVPHFIHAGSCSVYGRCKLATETETPRTGFPYGISKLLGERGVEQAEQTFSGFTALNFRMGTVCGGSPRMRFDLLVNAMVKDAYVKRQITVNDASAWRPVLDIRDAVDAYVEAVETPTMRGVVNLLSWNSDVMSVAERVQTLVERELGVKAEIAVRNQEDLRSYAASPRKAEMMGLKAKHDIDSTILDVIARVRELEAAGKALDAEEFYNIQVFRRLKL